MELLGRRYDNGQPVRLEILRGKIAQVTHVASEVARAAEGPWIAPGLIDIQVNGYEGVEFNSGHLSAEGVAKVVWAMETFGVTRFCPTLCTQGFEALRQGLKTIASACESAAEIARRIVGIHLEGPYISPRDGPRGVHPQSHCRPPDWEEFASLQEAAGGRIRIVTLAPELEGAVSFIERAVARGVVVAIGHTAADSDQLRAAVDAGARLSTHLGNGSHAMIHRHHNYIWDQLAEDRLMASLIADGQHLPPEVLKTFVRAKTPERCILISDMAAQAGLPPGRHGGSLCEVEVFPGGRLVVAGQREMMPGAWQPLSVGVAHAVRFVGLGLEDAVRMAVHHPAHLLGIDPGGLETGDPANLVLLDLDHAPYVRASIADGELVCGALS